MITCSKCLMFINILETIEWSRGLLNIVLLIDHLIIVNSYYIFVYSLPFIIYL